MTTDVDRPGPPILFVISGPSGVGKDAVIRELRMRLPAIHYAVTATTRPRRPGETPGASYYFLGEKQYAILLQAGKLLGPARVHGHLYGAPVDPIEWALRSGRDVLLKLDVQGAADLRRHVSGAVYIFLAPPSVDDLVGRLLLRQTETGMELERRIQDARSEMEQMSSYDYAVVNREGHLSSAVHQVACIVSAERARLYRPALRLSKS